MENRIVYDMRLTAIAKDNRKMERVIAMIVSFVMPYLIAICGRPGAMMLDPKGLTKVYNATCTDDQFTGASKDYMRRATAVVVHFLPTLQFLGFCGSSCRQLKL
jgi:hypothetical protein